MKNSDKRQASSPKAAQLSQSDYAPTMRMRRITSDELFAGCRELVIEHSGEEYRLRITSKGKLILTK